MTPSRLDFASPHMTPTASKTRTESIITPGNTLSPPRLKPLDSQNPRKIQKSLELWTIGNNFDPPSDPPAGYGKQRYIVLVTSHDVSHPFSRYAAIAQLSLHTTLTKC